MQKRSRATVPLLSKILLLDVFVVGVMLLLTVGLAAKYSAGLFEEGLEQNLQNLSQFVATNQSVVRALERGGVSPELESYLDEALGNRNNADIITIAGMDGIRIYHPDKSRIGQHFIGGDEGPALEGQNYSSKAGGTLGYQLRYFYPVYDPGGRQLGFVMVSMLMSNLDEMRDKVIRVHLQTLAIVFLIGAVAAGLITLSIKRSLLGYEPEQIVRRFLQRGEVMDSMEESVVAIDDRGIVILINTAAQELLDIDERSAHGRDIDDIFPQCALKESLEGVKDSGRSLNVLGESILCDRVPITGGGQIIGAVAVMRGRTEVTRLAEQLTGVNHLLDALRANTHEFMNQLHVILGLLQTGNTGHAKRFIMEIGQVQGETVSSLTRNFANQVLAALVLGKVNRCNELGIRMHVLENSRIPRHSRFLSTKSLITIVGNLAENAVDAILERGQSEERQEIALLVHEDEQSLIISLDDTGMGLDEDELDCLEKTGYTTKGEGRGTGMGLIRNVLEAFSGEMSVDSEKGVGTSIVLIFRKPRQLRTKQA